MAVAERVAEITRRTADLSDVASAAEIAEALGVYVHVTETLPEQVRGFCMPGTDLVVVRPDPSVGRFNQAIAHELAHLVIGDEAGENLEPACQRCGAALLLPREAFLRDVWALKWDLVALFHRWRYCSMESVASRISDLQPGSVATAWRNVEPKWRRGAVDDQELAELELEALAAVYCKAKDVAEITSGDRTARAYRMRCRDVRRAITVCQTG